ncbi:hypothetical protein SAMN02983003_0142 [Devosia enhydra]|uniref:Uncharacterized protein n=1 Tax=Devosia enhydra TaxID=665118 RepID=A0A1K2HSH5_9HYPH|nr:hypothetical protein [Devosia enhydra]SFZ80805.1 hypothetical protein SAMN02983003_0142 [Devosia enhydra]
MKATVDRLLNYMRSDYADECESMVCGIWSANGQIELRCGFTLRWDHELRQRTYRIPAESAATDLERAHLIAAAFASWRSEIEHVIVGFRDRPPVPSDHE